MAERRRRRRSENDSGEEFSQDTTSSSIPAHQSECESEGEHLEPELSEYESAADESRDRDDETETETESEEEDDSTAEEDSGDDVVVEGEEVVDEERQSGDGEEQPSENLDDDEDKQNPAYIPRKGAFFEHDLRMDPDADEKQGEGRGRGKGRLWKDETKWIHDRYMPDEQAPKSRQELIALYGYDIMSSDKPPEAPPRMNTQRGPRNRKFQDFIPSNEDRPRKPRYNSERINNDYDSNYPPAQSNLDDENPPPRRQNDRGRGQGGYRGFRGGGRGQRRNYSDLRDDNSQGNWQNSNEERGSDYRNEDNLSHGDNFGSDKNRFDNSDFIQDNRNRTNDDNYRNRDENYRKRDDNYRNRDDNYRGRGNYRGGRGSRQGNFQDRSDNYRENKRDNFRGNQENRDNYRMNRDNYQENRDNYRGNRDNYQENRDNYRGNKDNYQENMDNYRGNRDNYQGNRDNYRGNRDNFQGNRGNYRGNRDNFQDSRDNYRGNRDNYQENRDNFRGNKDNYRYKRNNDENQGSTYVQEDRNTNFRDDRQNLRFHGGQDLNVEAEQRGGRRYSNERSRELREETRERRSENVESRISESLKNVERTHLRPETAETRSQTYDKMKSYYTLSPVTDDEKLLNEGLDLDSSNSALIREAMADLNVTVSDIGSRKTITKEKRGYAGKALEYSGSTSAKGVVDEENDRRKQQFANRHQPTLPPRLQQERKKQAQSTPSPVPEKSDPAQKGSSKRYSSQRQRNVPEVPGFSEPPTIPPAGVSVPAPKLKEPAYFNPAFSPPKPGVNIPPGMMRPPPNFPPPVSGVLPASSANFVSPTVQVGPRVPSPQRVTSPQILPARPPGPPPPVFAASTSEPVTIIPPPPPQLPMGVMYAVPPPPTFPIPAQIAIPQFPAPPAIPPPAVPPVASVPQNSQAQPQESVRGGTTYYSSEGQTRSKGSGTTFYPPQVQKQSRVTVRRPKVAIPIVNPQDMKPGGSDEYLSASPGSTGLAPDDADMGGVNTPESPIPETNLYTTHTTQSPNEDSSYSDKTNVQDQNVHDTLKSPDTERVGETFVKDDNGEMASSREANFTSHGDEYPDNDRLGVSDKGDDNLDGVQKSDVDTDVDTDVKIESKNSEEEIRRRMVSDKLIPEVKLTFNVNTDTEVSQSQSSRETGKVGDVK